MLPQVGDRLGSTVCDTEVIVVRPPGAEVRLTCGGAPMTAAPAARSGEGQAPDGDDGTKLGKRYADQASGMELLCTKAGAGSLEIDGSPMSVKQAKNLPSSD